MCSVAISEIRQEKQASIEWHIKNWASDFDFLKDNAKCTLLVNGDKGDELGSLASPPVELRFYFKSYVEIYPDKPDIKGDSFLSLYAEVKCNGGQPKVIAVDIENTREMQNPCSVRGRRFEIKENREIIEVQRSFIHLLRRSYNYESYGRSSRTCNSHAENIPRDTELRLKISVTIFNFINALDTSVENNKETEATNNKCGTGVTAVKEFVEPSLTRDLELMYDDEENFADLKLETMDGVTLSAHRFILAARSPVFRKLIKEHMKTKNFSGTLKLPTVTTKPLIVILHWMYTGNLHEKLDKVMEKVVEICKMLEISELVKILDKKLITVCTTDNMLQLFLMAKQNDMKIAKEAISEFIKMNIDKV